MCKSSLINYYKFMDRPHAYSALVKRAATFIKEADALIITSGAGMSVDCGLPDFSGDNGLIKKITEANNEDYRNIINP
jgi:NAD-dependent SIR2 family protein deacetylase